MSIRDYNTIRTISIHALREEGDKAALLLVIYGKNFYPRPPRGGRRHRNRRWRCGSNFYPRPPRGGRPIEFQIGGESVNISIHALREEGDVQLGAFVLLDHLFLSTPSARRATFRAARFQQGEVHFYPHPP